jgi:hypothetical protein
LSDKFFLTEKQIECKFCGATIQIPSSSNSAIIKCESCKTPFEYISKNQVVSKLVFKDAAGKHTEYPLSTSTIMGRERGTNYLSLSNEIEQTQQTIYIRNPFVSRFKHARIIAKGEVTFFSNDEPKKLVEKKKWLIEDLKSTHGTSVNGTLLNPNELRELKHNDEICLAPNSEMPLTIKFIESLQER